MPKTGRGPWQYRPGSMRWADWLRGWRYQRGAAGDLARRLEADACFRGTKPADYMRHVRAEHGQDIKPAIARSVRLWRRYKRGEPIGPSDG